MKDKDDVMVKSLIPLIESSKDMDAQGQAIAIMYHIRGNVDKYFTIGQKEY